MKKSWIVAIVILTLLVCAGAAALLLHGGTPEFTGSRVKNPDAYELTITRMNGTDSHTLTLQQGNRLQVHFETTAGEMALEIRDPAGSAIYSGDGKACTDFTLDIAQNGDYTIAVTAKQGGGSLKARVLPGEDKQNETGMLENWTNARHHLWRRKHACLAVCARHGRQQDGS